MNGYPVWSYTTNRHGPYPKLGNCKSGSHSTENDDPADRRLHAANGHPERHHQMDLCWTVEETEVAARERIIWRYLSNQAVSAVMHDAHQ